MAFKPKPWERAAALARALRERLSAMEFEQVRDMAMATVSDGAANKQGGGVARKPKPKPDGKTAQNVKQQADHMGRLLSKDERASPNTKVKSPTVGAGGDAYAEHMARVHRK